VPTQDTPTRAKEPSPRAPPGDGASFGSLRREALSPAPSLPPAGSSLSREALSREALSLDGPPPVGA